MLSQSSGRLLPLPSALNARSDPGTTAWFASADVGVVAQRMPEPDAEPFAETAMNPPGMPALVSGDSTDPVICAGVLNFCVDVLKR